MIWSHVPPSVCGVKAGKRTANSSIGPVTRKPSRDGLHVLDDRVDHGDVVAGTREMRAQRPRRCARAEDIERSHGPTFSVSLLVAPRARQQGARLVHRDLPQGEHLVIER